MQFILTIPAQPATHNEIRQAVLFSCFRDGSLQLEERDGKKPARFTLTSKDIFPWEQYLPQLYAAWHFGDYKEVPLQFRPLKRIPEFVLEGIEQETIKNQLKILSTLRSQGYFPALPQGPAQETPQNF